MTFSPRRTSDAGVTDATKTLLYAHHGWGKTTQFRHYQRHFGKGFIISGESGLVSVSDADIDYLPFSSWDGDHDPARDVYSFRGICRMVGSPEFRAQGYKWIGLDSLTECSDRLMEHLEAKQSEGAYKAKGGKENAFEMWADYGRLMLGSLKWIRDLPLHVLVTCLAKEESDDNGATNYWPMIKGQAVGKQIPGLFDMVFCGVRTTDGDRAAPKVARFIVTEEVRGWHGKARDPRSRLRPVERSSDVTELLGRIAMPDTDYERWLKEQRDMQKETVNNG